MHQVRPPAVAGQFYPGDAGALRAQVRALLSAAREAAPARSARPKMIVVPHAGYVYSGAVAARGYDAIVPWAGGIRRVVLLGPTHRVNVRGLAAPTVDAFDTPLGPIALDRAALDGLADLPQVVRSDRVHAQEHSLEVQLPFLQTVLGNDWRLLPLAVGDASSDEVAEVIERLWGGNETLFVISTDLSHYLAYDRAHSVDAQTVARIVGGATDLDPHEACGAFALNGAIRAATRHGLAFVPEASCNSGDTAGDRSRVVGYAAFSVVPGVPVDKRRDDADDESGLGDALLSRARNAIARPLGLPARPEPPHAALQRPAATFVTLHDRAGALRGCIGTLQATRTLEADVRHHAHAAAFHDPRFAPLASRDWDGLRIDVSVLGTPQALPAAASRAEAAGAIAPGLDGIVLHWRGRSATLLPSVWAQLPDPHDFLEALGRKAGLPAGAWSHEVSLSRYRVREFGEPR